MKIMNGNDGRWHEIFTVMASGARREILVALMNTPPHVGVKPPGDVDAPDSEGAPERLRLELIHRHLPRMAEAGFVEWDRDPLRVRRGPRFDEVAAVLGAIDGSEATPRHLTEGRHDLEEVTVGL